MSIQSIKISFGVQNIFGEHNYSFIVIMSGQNICSTHLMHIEQQTHTQTRARAFNRAKLNLKKIIIRSIPVTQHLKRKANSSKLYTCQNICWISLKIYLFNVGNTFRITSVIDIFKFQPIMCVFVNNYHKFYTETKSGDNINNNKT